jgi:pterin-4a-carbinolamine dehydratase
VPTEQIEDSEGLSRVEQRLKAERIQERLKAERIQERLKAERIQERLAEVPGWRPVQGNQALRRTFLFPTLRAAALFIQLVYELGDEDRFVPDVNARYLEVTLTVRTSPEIGLTDLDFDYARVFQLAS